MPDPARRRSFPRSLWPWAGGFRKLVAASRSPEAIAVTSVAARVASEIGSPLGTEVGYQIRFENRTSAQTYVKFMTDGILLAEIHGDRLLRHYDTIILDEAHERSLTIDFLLGWLKRILPERPDLKVIVSSATLETARFSEFFDGAPVIEVEGRTHAVDVLYEPPLQELDLPEAVANASRQRGVARSAGRHPGVFAGRTRDPRHRERAPHAGPAPYRREAPLRTPLGGGAVEGVRKHSPEARHPGHERRRDVAHDPGHRLRGRCRPRPALTLRATFGDHPPADRGRVPGERRSAAGKVRPRPRGASAYASTTSRASRAGPALHRPGDQAYGLGWRHPSHEGARPSATSRTSPSHRPLPHPRSITGGLPRARGILARSAPTAS